MSNLSDYFSSSPERLFISSSTQESWDHRLHAPDGRMAFGFPVQREEHMLDGKVTLGRTKGGLLVLNFHAATPFCGFIFRDKEEEAIAVDTEPFVGVVVEDENDGTTVRLVNSFLMPVKSGLNVEQNRILIETLATQACASRMEKSRQLDLELQNILGNIN